MTRSELIASLVSSLAWPLCAVIVVFIFRRTIANLIQTLATLRYGSFQLDFKRELAQLQTEAAATPSPPADGTRAITAPEGTRHLDEAIAGVAQVSPAAGVTLAWQEIERELRDAAGRMGVAPDRQPQDSRRLIETLAGAGHMEPQTLNMLERMRHLRDHALEARPNTLTPTDVQDYGRLATEAIARIKSTSTK